MWMWPLLILPLSVFAQEESEKYCFKSVSQRDFIHREVKSILIPSDRVTPSDTCLTIVMKTHRRELIQQFIRRHDQEVNIFFSSAEVKRDICQLKVEKQKKLQSAISEINSQLAQTNTNNTGRETMQIQTQNTFELRSNQDVIKGECRFIRPERYEITLSVIKEPKPYYPANAPGTTVVLKVPPADQETSWLSTTVQLTAGEKIEIGSVVKDLRAKNISVSAEPSLNYKDFTNDLSEEIYLSID